MKIRDQRGRVRRSVGTGRLVRRRPGAGGFLLLEVLVAIALLAISVFVLIEGLSRCVAAARSVQNYSVSEILLANKCYEFRSERPTDILDHDGTFEDYPGYSWTRKFEGTDTEGLWTETITVTWYEGGQLANDTVVQYRYLPDKQR
jgi:type II secretory pathway pseudopilin PulG